MCGQLWAYEVKPSHRMLKVGYLPQISQLKKNTELLTAGSIDHHTLNASVRQKGRWEWGMERRARRGDISSPHGHALEKLQWNCETGQESRVEETPSAQLRKSGGVLTSESPVQGSLP